MNQIFGKHEEQDTGLSRLLLNLVDLCLLGILFVVPLFLGGRHPVGCLVFVVIVALMSMAWFLRQCLLRQAFWRSSAGQWIFLGTACLLILQLFPLSKEWIVGLSPDTPTLLPLWSPTEEMQAQLGVWDRISMYPQMTLQGLAMLMAYGLTFLITVQRINSIRDVQKVLCWIAIAVTGLAGISIVQYLAGNGKILWTYEHPQFAATSVQGPFTNRNHLCHALVLGIGPLIWWFTTKMRSRDKNQQCTFGTQARLSEGTIFTSLIGLGVALVVFTVIFSTSRGGTLALACALATLGIIYLLGSLFNRRYALTLLAFALLGIVIFSIHGSDKIGARWDNVQTMSLDKIDYKQMRQNIWKANWNAFIQNPWLGRGVGTHREYYKIFLPEAYSVEFSHAESGYLQVAGETGIAGLTFLVGAIGLSVFWCTAAFRRRTNSIEVACVGAVAAALMASVIHSIVDFVWYIPACMAWTMILCGLACRLYQLSGDRGKDPEPHRIPYLGSLAITPIVALIGIWMAHIFWSPAAAAIHWDRYQKYAAERGQLNRERIYQSKNPELQMGIERLSDVLDKKIENELRDYSMKHIDNARVNLRLAAIYLRRFQSQQRNGRNPMDVGQIRDAAIASQFRSRESLNQWLDRAIGEHRNLLDRALWHAHRAISLCPLQGEGYLFLADLCFLEGGTAHEKSNYVNQALLVRPYDGVVLLMAGKEAAIAGDVAGAIDYWKQSFQCGIENKRSILYLLSSRIPAEALIEMLEPQLEDWPIFIYQYTQLGNTSQLKIVCDHFYVLAQQQADSMDLCDIWYTLSRAYPRFEEIEKAASCAMRALECNSGRFDVHMQLATLLIQLEKFADAEVHLRWCVSRRPDARSASALLAKTVKRRIAQPASASTATLPGTTKH